MNTALIIGAAAIAVFIVWRAAQPSGLPPPAAPAQSCSVNVSGVGVSCGAIKAGAAAVKKAAVSVERGISSVPGALLGTNPKVSLFGQAMGTVSGPLTVKR